MTTIEIYIADDGTEFRDEEECRMYEDSKRDYSAVRFFDCEREEINPNAYTIDCLYSDANYLIIVDAERAKELFTYLYEAYGFEPPREYETGDILAYDEDDGGWYDLVKKIDELIGIYNKVKGVQMPWK